jgi:cell division transport system ATP-binding protein
MLEESNYLNNHMISAHNLSKRFGDILALDEVNFSVEPGEFVFLTGPSGSGKTTLLKLILREFSADKGEIKVNNVDLKLITSKKLPDYRKNIGIVFQDFRLLTDRSVRENVALPLEVQGVKLADIDGAVKKALEVVGLAKRANLFPAQLSGGELQRVALARAIVTRPKLILADEPTGNLDPKTAQSIFKLLRAIHEELKTTVLMATHNAEIVNHSSLRVIALDDGKVIRDTPKGKYE